MGLNISGLVGAGAQEGLEELLMKQLMAEREAESMRARRAQEQQARERLALDREAFAADEADRLRVNEDRDAARRHAANREGVADMERQAAAAKADADKSDTERVLDALGASIADPAQRAAFQASRAGMRGADADMFRSPEDVQKAKDAAAEAELQRDIRRINAQESARRRGSAVGQPVDRSNAFAAERSSRAITAAEALKERVSPWTTGYGGLLARFPQTEARKFAADLKALKANISFNELAEMRAASKTGGALGNVSDREMELLQSVLGGIDQLVDPADMTTTLNQIVASLRRWELEKQKIGFSLQPSHDSAALPQAQEEQLSPYQQFLKRRGRR